MLNKNTVTQTESYFREIIDRWDMTEAPTLSEAEFEFEGEDILITLPEWVDWNEDLSSIYIPNGSRVTYLPLSRVA